MKKYIKLILLSIGAALIYNVLVAMIVLPSFIFFASTLFVIILTIIAYSPYVIAAYQIAKRLVKNNPSYELKYAFSTIMFGLVVYWIALAALLVPGIL